MNKHCFVSIDTEEDLVNGESVLSFDGVTSLERVLPLFERYDVHATLFCTGRVIEQHSDILNRFVAAGHEIALHGFFDHIPMKSQSLEERERRLKQHIARFEETFGHKPKGFRAVQNVIDEAGMALLQAEGIAYDSSLLSFYPPGKSYVGYSGPTPRELYHPDETAIRSKGDMSIIEIPLISLVGGVQLQGRWIMKLRPFVMKWLLRCKKPELVSFSFHSWDVLEASFIGDLDDMLACVSKWYTFTNGTALLER